MPGLQISKHKQLSPCPPVQEYQCKAQYSCSACISLLHISLHVVLALLHLFCNNELGGLCQAWLWCGCRNLTFAKGCKGRYGGSRWKAVRLLTPRKPSELWLKMPDAHGMCGLVSMWTVTVRSTKRYCFQVSGPSIKSTGSKPCPWRVKFELWRSRDFHAQARIKHLPEEHEERLSWRRMYRAHARKAAAAEAHRTVQLSFKALPHMSRMKTRGA